VARYVVIADFVSPGFAFRAFKVGDVLDDSDRRVLQLLVDGAPIVPETADVTRAAAAAKYLGMGAAVAGSLPLTQRGALTIERAPADSSYLLNINSRVTGPSLLSMLGAPSTFSATGYYGLIVSDSCGLYTQGSLAACGASTPNAIALLASFMIGAYSDLGAGGLNSVYVSFSNAVNLDHFRFHAGDTLARPVLTVRFGGDLSWSDGTNADDLRIRRSAAATLDLEINAAFDVAVELSEPGANETAMLLRRNLAGVKTLQRVTMGVNDSGGAGFKLLRVPN